MGKFERHDGQTKEPPKLNLDGPERIFCNIDEQKWSAETTQKNGAHSESQMTRKILNKNTNDNN